MPDAIELPGRALASWFGSDRMIGPLVGQELAGCHWVGIPFGGAMSCLDSIEARSLVVCDRHRHIINLARAVAHPASFDGQDRLRDLVRRWSDAPFHPDMLARAQDFCRKNEPREIWPCDLDAAYWYFIASWMGRGHKGGTVDEFNGGLSSRWNANGGDSAVRYRSAVRAVVAWRRLFRRCSFHVLDALLFLPNCADMPETGIYVDPPFPGPGDRYKHKFGEAEHRELARQLGKFTRARVVCRFYDHELIRELYPRAGLGHTFDPGCWTWRQIKGRKQTNKEAPEVLILNGPSRAPRAAGVAGLFDGAI